MLARASILALALPLAFSPIWRVRPPMPEARSEVAAAALGSQVAVIGGYYDGVPSPRVDVYSPTLASWSQPFPDLPAAVDHASAAVLGGRLVVAGGHGAPRSAWVLAGGTWRALPRLPDARVAAGAAVLGERLYVVGGVGGKGLARNGLEYAPRRNTWRYVPGPTPRQHLAVVAAAGRLYAIGGRSSGFDTNVATVESWRPGERRWRREPALPEPRGGAGAAVVGARIVSIGGEAPEGTSQAVYVFDLTTREWSPGPDLPHPRHGLAVAAVKAAVYAVGGGPDPGLSASDENDVLCFARC